jgi:hypothetical protein
MIRSEAVADHAQRTELLRANGSNPLLIRDLLGDAQLWDLLRRTCRKQIADLKEFQTSYESKPWEILREHDAAVDQQKNEEFLKEFSNGVVVLEKAYNEGLDTLLNTSQDLIQLVLDRSF